eukprot:661267-Hanusia_phi.AAC.5
MALVEVVSTSRSLHVCSLPLEVRDGKDPSYLSLSSAASSTLKPERAVSRKRGQGELKPAFQFDDLAHDRIETRMFDHLAAKRTPAPVSQRLDPRDALTWQNANETRARTCNKLHACPPSIHASPQLHARGGLEVLDPAEIAEISLFAVALQARQALSFSCYAVTAV